ncbi:MAG: sulfatase family protein [Verrucomicrobiaceae bacterium]
MKRFLIALFGSLTLLRAAEQPNVVLILSDDQSWNDYSFMGHDIIETPRLDQFAAESLTYTRGYVTSPLCRPSLASIFTGMHTPHHGITGNDLRTDKGVNGQRSRIHPDWAPKHEHLYASFQKHPNLARSLTDAGYLSLQTGKFWEGKPQRHGFTHAMTHADPKRGGRHGDEGLKISRNGIAPIKTFLDEAKEKQKPFFIWHAPFLPHTPHNPPQELYHKYLALEPNKFVARYYAMVEWFDQTCGQLFDELDARGLAENTIVLYVTDNGWIQSSEDARYAPQSKQEPHDTGIRTPIMVRWTGTIAPRMDKNTLVSAIDLAPTILKACGVQTPDTMTGLDLRDTDALKKRNIVYGYDGNHDMFDFQNTTTNCESRYLVQGDWKLILHNNDATFEKTYHGRYTGRPDNREGKPELYNLKDDPFEKSNLAPKHPEKVEALTKALNAWWSPN